VPDTVGEGWAGYRWGVLQRGEFKEYRLGCVCQIPSGRGGLDTGGESSKEENTGGVCVPDTVGEGRAEEGRAGQEERYETCARVVSRAAIRRLAAGGRGGRGSQQGGTIKGNISAATLIRFGPLFILLRGLAAGDVCEGSQQGGTTKGNISAATLNRLRPLVYSESQPYEESQQGGVCKGN